MNVKLVVVFNHRFDGNIPILNRLYAGRFSSVNYLVPFYNGKKLVGGNRIIPVYDSSYQFNGFFAQGFDEFYDEDADYYFFVGDDVLLKPEVNENTVFEACGG